MYSAKVSTEKYLFLPLILSVGTSGSWTSSSAAASAGALASWSEKHLTLSLFVRLKHAQSVLLFRSELFLGGNFSATSPFMCHVYSLVQWIYWSLFFFWGGEHIVKFFFQEHTELAQRPRGTLVHQFEENLCSASGGGWKGVCLSCHNDNDNDPTHDSIMPPRLTASRDPTTRATGPLVKESRE